MLITAIGELLIDLTHAGFDPQGVELFAANPGGAPANVAAACAKLGAESAFIGRVGKDAFGESAVRLLRSCGVDTSGVSFDGNAPTTLAVVSLDGQGERSFQFYRDMGADTRLAREHVPDGMIASSRVLHFGSLSLTHEPCRSALLHALDVAEANGVLRSYDANYRASLWHGEGEAVEAMRYLLHRADIVKLSAEELALLGIELPDASRIPALPFREAKERAAQRYGYRIRDPYDLEPEEEQKISQMVREDTGSDFAFITHYPAKKRPFYAMDDPQDARYTLSFDLLFRGMEVTTGGQRIHDYAQQVAKMEDRGMDPAEFESYLMIHKHGMPPHGGLGIGLERLTMQLCGLDNVRKACLFPRDRTRLEP